MEKEGIAIVGIGCRFPGGINETESFWKLLIEGREAVREVPPDRWNIQRFYDPEPGVPGKSIAKRGGFVDGIDQFDPQFFGISPREAPYVDPQQRLLLETAWEAIEDAGILLDFERGTDLAVFAGISHNDYQIIQGTPWDSSGISPHSPTGSAHSIAANRISYCLNLRGPSIAMDTACSSALTAVHAACEHIRTGRGDMALAGGVTVMITPGGFIGFSQATMLSPDGHCKAFDASANGFVRGEGAGMVLLKRLSAAIEDGDPIRGVILGTSMNQDGHTNGISLPSSEAQARLVRDACADAGVDPARIGFVEAHGTGTAVGDPIEAHALAEALCGSREIPLAIGSVKTNLGHLETAAGIAGLIKAILVLEHRQIPPSLHFTTPNPNIDFDALKLRVPTELEPFPETDGPRMAGVNSFGFGGANTHVVVAEPPDRRSHDTHARPPHAGRAWPLMLSARSENSLRGNAGRLSAWLEERSRANGSSPLLPDLTYTLGARRNHHPHRLTLVASSMEEAVQELANYARGDESPKLRTSFSPRPEQAPRVAFVLSGQGPQWWGMGRELMANEPVFRRAIEECAEALRPWTRFDLSEELGRTEADSQISRTEIGQPAIFAMNIALAELWKSWGVQPAAVVGHSVSEVAAACIAGILDLDQAARIIALRSRFMEECARGEGTMLAVGLPEDEARAWIARHDRTATISAFNSPRSVTLSGIRSSLETIAAELEAKDVFARLVRVDHPFHHPLMQPAAEALELALPDLRPRAGRIPFFSTVTGGECPGEDCTAAHWAAGIRQPVRFAPAIDAIADFGVDVWLEIGAHPALAVSMRECLTPRGKPVVVASARREREHEAVLESALELHGVGVPLDFRAMTHSRRLLPLPAYAWDKSRWWSESSDWRDGRLSPGGRGLLDCRLPRANPTWVARLDNRHMAFLKDHKVDSHVIFPAAGFVELALEVGVQWFEGRPFAIEDFEIRKPLLLPEPSSGVQIEFSFDPKERTFSIQSRFEQAGTWSVHVVGSMRGERTDSAFAASEWEPGSALRTVEVDGFYQHMSDMGLRYGEEFRPIRELAASAGASAGKVALSEAIARRAPEYALHPVLFDGALQIFSAGAATVEDRRSPLKLPVRFSRILFLRTPGASSRVSAGVRQFNSEFLEGDIRLYDEAGRPCVLVDGFRAVSVSGGRRSGGNRDVIYHIDWERTSVLSKAQHAPIPLSRMREVAHDVLTDVIETRGRARLESEMADADALTAGHLARGFRAMGVVAGAPFSAESIGIADSLRPAFGRLMLGLSERGLMVGKDGSYAATEAFEAAANSAQDTLRAFLQNHPGHLAEAQLCMLVGGEVGAILRGEKDAVQVLFGGVGPDWLDQFYGDALLTSHWLAAIGRAVEETANHLPEGRGLRILEVGAGTGGLASQMLPLLERRLHSYTFTDASPAFFSNAGQKLAAFPEVEFKIFDLEKSGPEQGFEPESFDLVIGTNVLHAVADVRAGLRRLHELLVPGGSLLFMDVSNPSLWTETVFGLTSGWWRLTDRDLRPEQPLIEREKWESVLRETGFSEAATLPGLAGPRGGEGQFALFARKRWVEPVAEISPLPQPLKDQSWLILAGADPIADRIASRLRESGARCRVARRGEGFVKSASEEFTLRADVAGDWIELLTACADGPPSRIVYLWTPDVSTSDLMGTEALLHLAQAIATVWPTARLRLDVVTRGAQPAGRGSVPIATEQAAAIGLLRVIRNEYANIACRGIDLPPTASASDPAILWDELMLEDSEREVAFRGDARFAPRLDRGRPIREQPLEACVPLRLESRDRGHLDTLRFAPFELPACRGGEVLIEVKAAGMNFRDVLKALALYPGEAPDARIFGDEVAGIVKAVGEGVDHVVPGDRVFGLATFGLATGTIARGGDLRRIPEALSFEEAATLPVVFMTAWHAIQNVARMRPGESILIQAGAGGVGMAAIQIAQHLGVEIIATAGNPAKRALLETMGVKHVIDSRHGDFADAVMEITNRRGVDVVLNSLAGEAIPMGLSCLAEFGRFIEIGKRDIYQNSRIPLRPLRQNASFHVVAMDAVFHGDEALARQLLGDIAALVESRALRPLPFRSFPACRVDAAFRLMAQGKHIGKVVVAFPRAFVPRRAEPPVRAFSVTADGCYLVTGAFGGFGRILSQWLVECGARHLVLAGRSGAASPDAEAFVQKLRGSDVTVHVAKVDVGSSDDVARLMEEIRAIGQPLRGVFHLAMVIDDAPLASLDAGRMRAVMLPKARGAWLLHEATRGMPLDCFAMFSSVSSIFGNPAQGNYAAANAFLDALAHHRRALGLPALAVNWGALGGAGFVARNEKVGEFLARQGTAALTPGEVMSILETFLATGVDQALAIRVDWSKWRQFFRGLNENPMLEKIFAGGVEGDETGATTSDWRGRLEAAAPEERVGVIGQAVREIVGSVLRVKPDTLRDDQPLTDLGLDSLMGVEIETSLDNALGVALPPTSLMRARTIGQIATLIAEHMGEGAPPIPAPPTVATSDNATIDDVDLDALSSEDIDRLLGDHAADEAATDSVNAGPSR